MASPWEDAKTHPTDVLRNALPKKHFENLSLPFSNTLTSRPRVEDDYSRLRADTQALFQAGRDLAEVKLAIDRMVDPTVNIEVGRMEIDRTVDEVKTTVPNA
ncbi:hypothetical protein N185_15855 [Sinorhizobium sp. GW3]|nr:hypothetical protein N185_15855 [Sinorhizobium sp. GW3]